MDREENAVPEKLKMHCSKCGRQMYTEMRPYMDLEGKYQMHSGIDGKPMFVQIYSCPLYKEHWFFGPNTHSFLRQAPAYTKNP